MHELSVTESILSIAQQHAQHSQASRVTDIHIIVGQLASIVDDSVQFYWDIISQGTICEGAQLHFERIPATLLCLECNTEYQIQSVLTPCPTCNSYRVKVISGEQFWLESIEIER
jgi:hydrogenase nickel incorporation protein HypA/HybF